MNKEELKKSRILNLKKTQKLRKDTCLESVYKAIERLQNKGAKINFSAVAKEANLSVSYLYKYPELKQHIAQLRSQQSSMPVSSVAKPASSSHTKVVSRLKQRLHQLEEQNQELRRKNEALAGQVYRVHYLQEQVERQQQTIEDLHASLNEAHEQKSLVEVTSISRKTKEVSKQIESELEALQIPLNTTLNKTIKSASEETVLNAIEALKEAMANKDIPSPGGWLSCAIKDGWTKNKPQPQQILTYTPPFYTAPEEYSEELVSPDQIQELMKQISNDRNA